MVMDGRIGLRTRALLGAVSALLGSTLGFGGVVAGHATTTWACAVDVSWTTVNTIAPNTAAGTLFVSSLLGSDSCVVGTTSPIGVNVKGQATYSADYTYSGDCAEGTLAFTNGTVGVFISGILVAEQQSAAGAGVLTAVGEPLGIPCTGGSSIIWAGPGTEAGG